MVVAEMFQSTPVIANGRIRGGFGSWLYGISRFNPRPLLLTGESCPGWTTRDSAPCLFQSTPVIANGRILGLDKPKAEAREFQSTPVIANGRIRALSFEDASNYMFQSTPVIANGRI